MTTVITFILVLTVIFFFMASLMLKRLVKGDEPSPENCDSSRRDTGEESCAVCGHFSNGGCAMKGMH